MNKKQLVELAYAKQALLDRFDNERIAFYQPCCAIHGGRKPDDWAQDKIWTPAACPAQPCEQSKHVAFHRSKARNRVVFGGNRSSKTFTCTKEFVFRMTLKKHPFTGEVFRTGDRHGRILAQDYALHEKKHIPELQEWIPTAALAGAKGAKNRADAWERSYDSRNHILHLVNNGWIDFQTYEQDSSKGESVDLDVWFADEEIPRDWYDACNARIITRRGAGIMGVTPLYRLTWAMEFLDSVNPDVAVFKWGIRDNPHNSTKDIETFLAGVSPLEREARENGEFIEFKGIRYKELDATVHLIQDPKPPQRHWPVVMAMDPHQRKGTAIVWAYVDPSDTITFFDEILVQGTADDVVRAIREREKGHVGRTQMRIADPAIEKQVSGFGSSLTTHDEFIRAGMSFGLADNSEAGYNVVSSYLRYDKTKPLGTLNRPSVYFTKDCPKLWYSMTHLMWDEYKFSANHDPKERVKDKDKDFADCCRYVLAMRPTSSIHQIEPVDIHFDTSNL